RIGVTENLLGLSLLSEFIKYSDQYSWSGIGTNVFPASTGIQALARHEINKENLSYQSGVALYTKARFAKDGMDNWYTRRSIWNDGNMFSIGQHALFNDGYIGQAYTDTITSNIGITHT